LAAVQQNGTALAYANDKLRRNINFCIECAKKNPEAISYFEGEAKELFEAHNNDIDKIEEVYAQQQQNKANEVLLAKLSKTETAIPTNKLFKRKIDIPARVGVSTWQE
jgi:hypothetical protein